MSTTRLLSVSSRTRSGVKRRDWVVRDLYWRRCDCHTAPGTPLQCLILALRNRRVTTFLTTLSGLLVRRSPQLLRHGQRPPLNCSPLFRCCGFGVWYPIMRYTIPEEQIGPNAGGVKLEPTKAPYRVFRLISSPLEEEPHAKLLAAAAPALAND